MLNYITNNKESEETIIFIHTQVLGKWIWKKQYYSFNEYECYFIDLPNHGDSFDLEKFTINNCVEELKKFIMNITSKNNKTKHVNLIGIGIGGIIGLDLFSKYPELVDKIIISNVFIPRDEQIEDYNNRSVEYFDKSRVFIEGKKKSFIISGWFSNYGISKNEFWNDMEKSIYRLNAKDLKDISFQTMNYKINKPKTNNNDSNLLIMYGSKDECILEYSSKKIHKLYPKSTCIQIENANHLWNINDYKLFNKICKKFLRKNKITKEERIKIK